MTSPFMTMGEARDAGKLTMRNAPYGTRLDSGVYKAPLLPGEQGPKSGDPWVSRGLQSMTNLAASISDTKALGDWDRRQTLIGFGLHPDLVPELRRLVWAAKEEGVDFQNLRAHKDFSAALDDLAERAKDISGANAARDAGITLHETWETGDGAEEHQRWIARLAELLDDAGLEVIPELVERTVRNVAVRAMGRFDNILLERKTGRLLIADLKTKRNPFWSMLEIDAQLAGYAYAEWMLNPASAESYYDLGPMQMGVDLTVGVVLHMPSDGGRPYLRKADLVEGWETLQVARRVCTQRSKARSVGHMAESYWGV